MYVQTGEKVAKQITNPEDFLSEFFLSMNFETTN